MRYVFTAGLWMWVFVGTVQAAPPSDATIVTAVDSALSGSAIDASTFLEAKFYYIEKPKCFGVVTHDFIFVVIRTTGGVKTRVYGLVEDNDGAYAVGLLNTGKLPAPFATTTNFHTLRYALIRASIYQAFIEDLLVNGLSKIVAYNAMLFAPITGRPCANVARALRDLISRAIAEGFSNPTKVLYCKCSTAARPPSFPLYAEVRIEDDGTLLVWGSEYPWVDDWVATYHGKACAGWKHELLEGSKTNKFTLENGFISFCSEKTPDLFKIAKGEWKTVVDAPDLSKCKNDSGTCAAPTRTPTATALPTQTATARPTATTAVAPTRTEAPVPTATVSVVRTAPATETAVPTNTPTTYFYPFPKATGIAY